MRFGLLFATAASLIVHALMLWLLPQRANTALQPPPGRMHARLMPTQPEPAKPTALLETAKPSAPTQPDAAPRRSERSPVFTATTAPNATPSATPIAQSGSSQIVEPSAGEASSLANAPLQPAAPEIAIRNAPLNLTVPTAKLPPRTVLQATIEQEAIRPDATTRSFERVLAQTAPVTTEITQTVDASGNATVKVRTPGGTYCLKNATPAGATLYDLKTLAGNCAR